MRTRKNIAVLLTVLSLILAGCSANHTPAVALSGTSWTLTGLASGAALAGAKVTFEFSDGKITGSDGCNSYGGSATLKGSKFSVGNDIASTLMACADPIMQQATAFYDALEHSVTYKVDGQQLTLLDAGGKVLATFTKQSSSAVNGGATSAPTTSAPATSVPALSGAADRATDTAAPATNLSAAAPTQTAVPTAAATRTPASAPSIAQALPNLAYPLEGTSTGFAQLKDGVFEEAIAPGSASKIHVQLTDQQAFGDLNGDGAEDAAVILSVDTGGSGVFSYLAVAVNDQGVARPIASLYLDDRIVIKSLTIQAGNIVVDLLTRSAGQPMSAEPTVAVTRTFQLRGDKLIEVENQ